MPKRSDKPDKMTEEQRERLLVAGDRLLALGYEPASFIEKMADSEEKLRQRIEQPATAPTAALAEAVRHVAGVWAAPSVLSRLAEMRTEIGDHRSYLDKHAPQAAYLRRTPRAEKRLRELVPALRKLTDAFRYVPSDVPAAEARRNRGTQRALAFLLDEDELVQTGVNRAQARTLLAPKYGFRPQKQKEGKGPRGTKTTVGPRGGNTTPAESVSRWLRDHPEARELFERATRGRNL